MSFDPDKTLEDRMKKETSARPILDPKDSPESKGKFTKSALMAARIAAASIVASVGGYYGVKKGLGGKDSPESKTPTTEVTHDKVKKEEMKSEVAIPKPSNVEEARAAVLKNMEIKKPIETKPKIIPQKPIAETYEELIAKIEAKLARGEKITADEASIHNAAIPYIRAQIAAHRKEEELVAKQKSKINTVINSAPHISEKISEKVNEIYENIIEKVFPENTLQIWMSVKNKNAYEFMTAPEEKIIETYKPLFRYLHKLEEITKLKPKSGIRENPENIEKYIERTLQYASSNNLLEKLV